MPFDQSAKTLIGFLYLGLAGFILPFHLMILSIFIAYQDCRTSAVYVIMLSIGMADCLQLIAHVYSGIITLTENNFSDGLEKFLGGLANAAWIAMIAQTLVLSLNRLYIFRNSNRNQKVYSVLVMLICCWIFGGAFFILYMTNLTRIVYNKENFYWEYDSGEWSETISAIEYYTCTPILCLTFIVHLIIIISIVMMRNSLTSDKRFLVKRELMLLIQSFVIFLYTAVMISSWHFYTYWLPDSPWSPVSINICWILFGGLNPVLYLTMNSTIRERFFGIFLLCRRKNDISVIVISR